MERRDDPTTFVRAVARAEAATADEVWEQAALWWEQVVATNPVEGRFWSKLGEARYRCGAFDTAIDAFEQALELRDGFPAETAYAIARCHAQSGDIEAALDAIDRALALGYRHLANARGDEALSALRAIPRFRAQVGLIDTSRYSRDEGWRGDLQFLVREVKRIAYDPFRYVSEERFDAIVAGVDRAIPGLSDTQVVIEFEKLLVLLGDGHASLIPDPALDDNRRGLPVQFFLFEEGVFLIAAAAEHRELLGAQVLAIDECPVEQALQAVKPLICRDNEQWLKQVGPHRLRELPVLHALGLIPDPERTTLTLRGIDGAERTVKLTADSRHPRSILWRHFYRPGEWLSLPETLASPMPLTLMNVAQRYWFEELPGERMIYAQINSVQDHPGEPLDRFTARLLAAAEEPGNDRLVIDLRWNPGGNTFLLMPLLHGLIGSGRINRPGRLFVIIGRGTFSAAQNFSTLLERHTDAIFVGEPTGSSPTFIGETIEYQLPYSHAYANASDLLWQSGWAMDYRPWIAPLLYTPPVFAAYKENRDPAMEAILAVREQLPGARLERGD